MYRQFFENIQPDERMKCRIEERIESNMNRKGKMTVSAALVCAACITVIGTGVFAASPTGQEVIGNIISYFQSDKANDLTSIEELSKYNEAVGISATKHGYTLTLDNIATDDNFLHVFYTLKSENLMDVQMAEDFDIRTEARIDGRPLITTGHIVSDGYMLDDYTYKGVKKYTVASMDIPDVFNLELIYMDKSTEDIPYSNKLVVADDPQLSERLLFVSTTAHKADVSTRSLVKTPNVSFNWDGVDATVKKVVISPFGNQMVIETKGDGLIDGFAAFDENGVSLDIKNAGLCQNTDGTPSENTYEFMKGSTETESLTLVPTTHKPIDGEIKTIKNKIGSYPIRYELSKYGSIVVTGVRISDGAIAIDYYKDGFTLFDPGFMLENDNAENVEPGGKLGCTLYTLTHQETNSYTALYKYEAYDENGKIQTVIPDEICKENLEKSFTTLGIYSNEYIDLDYSRAVTVNLK